jgi:hypothetical protein
MEDEEDEEKKLQNLTEVRVLRQTGYERKILCHPKGKGVMRRPMQSERDV